MKKISLVIVSGLLMGLSSVSFAQNSANANANANATVVKPISITWNQPLAFGNLTTPSSPATSTMDVSGLPTADPNNASYYAHNPTNVNTNTISIGNNIYGGDGSPGPAVFTVNGQFGFAFIVTLPTGATPVPIHLANNTQVSADLLLDNLTCKISGNAGTGLTGVLSQGVGYQFFAVGGRLSIPASTPSGWYQGTFNVGVAYN